MSNTNLIRFSQSGWNSCCTPDKTGSRPYTQQVEDLPMAASSKPASWWGTNKSKERSTHSLTTEGCNEGHVTVCLWHTTLTTNVCYSNCRSSPYLSSVAIMIRASNIPQIIRYRFFFFFCEYRTMRAIRISDPLRLNSH
jgi:hypothetical protein